MFEFRFADHSAFQFLWLVPLLVGLIWWISRRTVHSMRGLIEPRMLAFLTRSVSVHRRRWKVILQCLAMISFVFALARPQSGEGRQKAKSEGLELMLVVDVSNSMMAEDARPSRLELAKRELSRLVDELSGDKVGLVAFAGSAILLSPMSTDKAAIKMFLESLEPESVSTQGTDFRRAISEAHDALKRGSAEDEENQNITRVIVLVSDGEETEKGGIEAAQRAAADGIRIFTLGVGTEQGGQIPMRDRDGNLAGYKRDKSGQVVISKFADDAMKSLAEAGKGQYQHITFGGDAVRILRQHIDKLERAEFASMEVTHYNEHYQSILTLGLVLALLEVLLGERKREGRIWRGRFEVPLD